MKVGVIGAGYWGKKHVDEYSALGHEIFVSDLSDHSLEFCELNYGAQTTNDYHDVLNDDEIKSPKFILLKTKNTITTIAILSKYFFNLLEFFGVSLICS